MSCVGGPLQACLSARAALQTALFVCLALVASRARADDAPESSRHRFWAGAGRGSVGTGSPNRSDSANTRALRVVYAYHATSPFEVGAGTSVYAVDGVGTVVAPHVSGRFFTAGSRQGGYVQFGVTVHLGATIGDYGDATWFGVFMALAPDLRVPLDRNFAFQLSGELANLAGTSGSASIDRGVSFQPSLESTLWCAVVFTP